MIAHAARVRAAADDDATTLRLRALAWERYAELLLRQIDALDGDDLTAFERIALDRDALAHDIDSLATPDGDRAPADSGNVARIAAGDPEHDMTPTDQAELTARIGAALRRCADGNARLHLRLREMRDDALAATRTLDRGRGATRAYTGGQPAGGSLDLGL